GGLLGSHRSAAGLEQAADEDQERLVRPQGPAHPLVRGRRTQRQRELPRPPAGQARRQGGDHLRRRRPEQFTPDHLPRAACGSVQVRQHAEEPRRGQGRPRGDLPADDPGGGGGHAGLRPARRDPLGGVRRLLARFAGRAHRRLAGQAGDHRRRGPARGQAHPAQGQCGRRTGTTEHQQRETVVVVRHTGGAINMQSPRDRYYHALMEGQSADCPPTPVEAEHPLFVLYTSGSTGKPKGVLHTTGGYLVYTSYTHELVFDLREDDVYWCTADVGWVTGHSYVVYGPLANGATTVMFEGVPNYPDHSRFWQVIDKHRVSLFYTAPTAIRALMREGEAPVKKTSRASLRLLGSVGEPINPEAWEWYHRVVGDERCPIVDTWWQTETGGILISPLPGAIATKPGSATLPFFGVKPAIVDSTGNVQEGACEGNLVLTDSWPGQMRTVYGDHQRFIDTYFNGDGARRDDDGYYWITGRVDDVINVSGHRLGTAEVESALVAHAKVAEAAVVGCHHDIKGQGIYAYVTLKAGEQSSDALRKELIAWVRKEIGAIATPDHLQWAPGLPKTRSGKIMRRILRKIAENQPEQLGDISTLADPSVVKNLVDERLVK